MFREVWRVLRDDGTVWLNLGDSYAAMAAGRDDDGVSNQGCDGRLEAHRAIGSSVAAGSQTASSRRIWSAIPWRVAFALQADGWYLRSDIIWTKPNPMPESR